MSVAGRYGQPQRRPVPQTPAPRCHDWPMATGVLSFPFKLNPDGTAATVGYGTDREVEEAIAALVLTHIGERLMNPSFGVPDPVFSGLGVGDIQVGLDQYGPAGITIQSVTTEPVDGTDQVVRAKVAWQYNSDGTGNGNNG
ncbi:baseplate wedge subunit [Arthrobacter phage vB_ArtM-ArV1]|uniref:Baseplate wedge subunit n=1 Tax=Arthrobacter phage vB_ArtM-ArV1 TaxID=1566993 RepID=A0A0A7HE52_9CAUD|nr:baseplate protein [Arthrobacter phage vB_ArtM-ArV1]AIZ01720.1 baseplate wedge subunit [Arthrobacter phage vB_ArtM-ArV1]